MSVINLNDEKRFCSKCVWNECDYGCICPPNEEVYQCAMYMHYHPDEVNGFNKAMEEWAKQKAESEEAQPKQTDASYFDFDKVKEILKKDNLDNLIVDHTCEEKQEQIGGEADGK